MEIRRLLLGEVVGVFGVKGQLKLRSFTAPPEAIARYRPWFVELRGKTHEIAQPQCRIHGKGLLLQLPDVLDRDQAEAWIGAQVYVDRERLPDTAPGEYYWVDLEGLAVETVDGLALGRVSHLFSTGSNDVMSVHGERERLIPFLQPDVVRSVDIESGRIVVDWDPEF